MLVGDARTGKTRWVKRMLGISTQSDEYLPTRGVEVRAVRRDLQPPITLNIWDSAGNPKFGGLCEGYYVRTDIFLVMGEDNGWSVKAQDHDSTVPVMHITPDTTFEDIVTRLQS